jgi:ABC-type uncharacterized transport system permease subunit
MFILYVVSVLVSLGISAYVTVNHLRNNDTISVFDVITFIGMVLLSLIPSANLGIILVMVINWLMKHSNKIIWQRKKNFEG